MKRIAVGAVGALTITCAAIWGVQAAGGTDDPPRTGPESAIEALRGEVQAMRDAGLAPDDPKITETQAEIDRLSKVDPSMASSDSAGPDAPPESSGEFECEAMPGITDKVNFTSRPRCVRVMGAPGQGSILVFITDQRFALAVYGRSAAEDSKSLVHDIPLVEDLARANVTVTPNGTVEIDKISFDPWKWFES